MIKIVITAVCFFSAFGAAHILIPTERYVTFYFVAATLLALAFGRDLPDSYRIQKDGIVTNGIVRNTDCANHGHITYDFQVGNQSYSKTESASIGGLNCNDIHVGMDVPVRYLATSPDLSFSGNAHQRYSEKLEIAVLGTFGFPALMLFFYFRKMRQ
ncbi:MAG TPA: hypothetical protein VIF82_05400 [Burkholderiaceae bacterium]|jgi:hypothetical protein